MNYEELRDKFGRRMAGGLVEELINEPSAHYVHILLLRSSSPARSSQPTGRMRI